MLAPALRQDLLERLDGLARPPGEVPQGPLLELVVDLFLAQSEVEEPERRRACLDLALSLVPRAAPEALRAIASRPGLTEDVADAIVRRGDRDAVALLVANRSARLSPDSLAAVADLAWRDAGLRGAFVQRSDLPGAIVDKLWPSLHSGFKARLIASGFRYSMSEVEEVGRETSAALSDAGRSGALPQSIDTYAALVRDRLIAIDEALVEIMQNGRLVEAAQLIARCLGLGEGVALNLLYGVYDHGPAVLACHAGLSEDVILRIAEARARLSWVPSTDLSRMRTTAKGITGTEAAEILSALDGLWQGGVANTGDRRRFRSAA
jgi:Uncharacterised protein conserved in bacteria (DUF2336)